jgi:hypothetical protein
MKDLTPGCFANMMPNPEFYLMARVPRTKT